MTISILLAAGSGAATSSDVAVADGSSVTLNATGHGSILVQPKLSTGYGPGSEFGLTGNRSVQVSGPITFRVARTANSGAGVDMEAA